MVVLGVPISEAQHFSILAQSFTHGDWRAIEAFLDNADLAAIKTFMQQRTKGLFPLMCGKGRGNNGGGMTRDRGQAGGNTNFGGGGGFGGFSNAPTPVNT
eukprot:Lankesteria_metandrocarpae@DN154_c1_g1_i1.p1